MENIIYRSITGHLNTVKGTLNRKIGQFKSQSLKMKIGITNNPERRFKQHLRSGNWDKMVVIYETQSERYIRKMEEFLVERHWYDTVNIAPGGGGNLGSGPYFVYLLLR